MPLHALIYLEDNGEVVIGRADIDSYGVFPPDGAALVGQLAAGMPPAEAGRWYADTYGEQVDMAEFLDTLGELQFLGEADPGSGARPVRWQRLGRWMFSPVAWGCYVLVIAAAAAAMIARPRLAPHPANLFFTHYVTLLAVVVFAGQFPLILLHESFHMLAGRRLGLRTSLRLGRPAVLPGIRNQDGRAGRGATRAAVSADAVGSFGRRAGHRGADLDRRGHDTSRRHCAAAGSVCLAFAFTTALRFAWQFYVYLRTDLYYATVTVLGCLDLQQAARRILANRFRRLAGRPLADQSLLHPRDLAVGRWYSWLMLAGYVFSLTTLAVAIIPLTWQVLVIVFGRFIHGSQSWGQVLDSVLFLALNLAQIIVILIVVLRSHWRRRTASSARPAA